MVTGFQYNLKEKLEDAAADVKDAVKGDTGKKVLTGGSGPWGVGTQQAPLLERLSLNPMKLFGNINTDNPNTDGFGSARPGPSWFRKFGTRLAGVRLDTELVVLWRLAAEQLALEYRMQKKEPALWERILWGGDRVVDAGRKVGDRVRREASVGGGGAWT